VEIISGLQLPDIQKLKLVWGSVSAKNTFNKLKGLTEANYAKLQDKLHNIQPPCLPYLGAYLNILSDLESKHPDMLEGLINFEKRTLIGGAIAEINQYQQTLYCLDEVSIIQDWMANVPIYSPSRINEESVTLLTRGPKAKSKKEKDKPTSVRGKDVEASPASQQLDEDGDAQFAAMTRTGSLRGTGGVNSKLAKVLGVDAKVLDAEISKPRGSVVNGGNNGGSSTGSPRPSVSSDRRRSSSSNGSSGELGIDKQSALKFQMLSIFYDDAEFREKIQEVLLKDLTAAISKEMTEFKSLLRSELAVNKGGGGGIPAAKDVLQHHWPGRAIAVWSGNDAEGFVFGWSDNVSVHTVFDGRQLLLADVRETVTKADISTFLRVAQFYAQYTRTPQPKFYLFGRSISEESKAVAQRATGQIELISF